MMWDWVDVLVVVIMAAIIAVQQLCLRGQGRLIEQLLAYSDQLKAALKDDGIAVPACPGGACCTEVSERDLALDESSPNES